MGSPNFWISQCCWGFSNGFVQGACAHQSTSLGLGWKPTDFLCHDSGWKLCFLIEDIGQTQSTPRIHDISPVGEVARLLALDHVWSVRLLPDSYRCGQNQSSDIKTNRAAAVPSCCMWWRIHLPAFRGSPKPWSNDGHSKMMSSPSNMIMIWQILGSRFCGHCECNS